jgi:negative regulator of sigma E activity
MNEEERLSQVSALFDGTLSASQSELVLRRVMKDPALRATWGRYAVIGASLRHEPLSVAALGRDDIATRVAAALADEPVHTGTPAVAAASRPGWTGPVSKALWGSALAAGVAAASILVLRMQVLPEPGGAALVADARSQQSVPRATELPAATPAQPVVAPGELSADAGVAPSYTTPAVSNRGNGLPAPLVNYVVAHAEYLTPVMRFNPLSAVMNGSFESDELVEATEAEIGAARR